MCANAVWTDTLLSPHTAQFTHQQIEFSKSFSVNYSRLYEVQAQCDERAEFYINGKLFLTSSNWVDAPNRAVISLTAGVHTLRVFAVNNIGGAGVAFTLRDTENIDSAKTHWIQYGKNEKRDWSCPTSYVSCVPSTLYIDYGRCSSVCRRFAVLRSACKTKNVNVL